MKKLSIVVPCYNESGNIQLLLERFSESIGNRNIEVVLVDNGSLDATPSILAELQPKYLFATTTRVEKNQGYGFGILSGLREATGDFLGWMHADMQSDPNDIVRAYDIILKNNSAETIFVKGMRTGRPIFDTFFTVGMSCYETIYQRMILWDINAQPNIFHRNFYQRWNNPPHDFALDLYVYALAKKQNLNVIRFPVLFGARQFGTSSWNSGLKARWKFVMRTVRFSGEVRKQLSQ